MTATGIVRKTDDIGRVVIPLEIRKAIGFEESQRLEMFIDGDSLILRKYKDGCAHCGGKEGVTICGYKFVCFECSAQAVK